MLLYLLENGAEIDAKNKFHQTSFFLACDNNHKLCAEVIYLQIIMFICE